MTCLRFISATSAKISRNTPGSRGAPPSMTFTYERRLATFRQLNWPHSSENKKENGGKKFKSQPEDFAQAGFYCRPMVGSEDTVSCFLCLKSLDGWEPTDSAWQEHKSHSSGCPLVTLNLFQSRLRTFDRWCGEKVAGGVSGLAEAGFFYFPKSDGDDTCICYQCGLALDGWEANDDPHHEHSRRRPNCPHVVNKEYIKPASFDFILAGKSDDLAVKDISQRDKSTQLPPVTPARRTIATSQSTVKSKKIRISVPTTSTDDNYGNNGNRQVSSASTPQSKTASSVKITMSTAKKPSKTDALKDFLAIFPEMKENGGEILNWTMEELLERLIREKVGKFEEFLKQIEAE